jgi:hypothetical protein
VRLAATRAEPLRAKQFVSLLADDSDADVLDLIDVLTNRVGAAKVYRYAHVASDVPERATARVPAASADPVDELAVWMRKHTNTVLHGEGRLRLGRTVQNT